MQAQAPGQRGPDEKIEYTGEVSLPSDKKGLETARRLYDKVNQAMTTQGYPNTDCRWVHLGLEEMVANAMSYGNESSSNRNVTVSWDVNGERVKIAVEDEGGGKFSLPNPEAYVAEYWRKVGDNPAALQETRGRGLLLLIETSDEIQFNHARDASGGVKGLRVEAVYKKDSPRRESK